MNERERWVVYPLLFLALGASLRDKFLKHVTTDDIQCRSLKAEQLVCNEVVVTDPAKPDRVVARLTTGMPAGAGPDADRFGVLALIDSEGRDLCNVTNQVLQVRDVHCYSLSIVDPDRPGHALAKLLSVPTAPLRPGDPPQRTGLLALNNREYTGLLGVPPVNRPALAPPANLPAAEGENPPAARPPRDGDAR